MAGSTLRRRHVFLFVVAVILPLLVLVGVVPAAFDQYLRGITLMERVNHADIDAAIQAFERAVDLDPGFADAFGALAIA